MEDLHICRHEEVYPTQGKLGINFPKKILKGKMRNLTDNLKDSSYINTNKAML